MNPGGAGPKIGFARAVLSPFGYAQGKLDRRIRDTIVEPNQPLETGAAARRMVGEGTQKWEKVVAISGGIW